MKNTIITAALMLMMLQTIASASTKRALVIGIGPYPKESGWSAINGDKDIPVIVEILEINGFKSENIAILRNEQATKEQIRASIKHLTDISKSGDKVYIHFSGHGQQVTDVHKDEKEGLDEAWIPYDAQAVHVKGKYEGDKHILDDELNIWFSALTNKLGDKGHLTVSVDACHSGDSWRGAKEDSVCVRGALANGLQKGFDAVRNWLSKEDLLKLKAEKEVKWTMISACRPGEINREYHGRGSLTTALREIANQLGKMTAEEVRVKVRNWMHDHNYGDSQLPMVNPERKNNSFL